MDDQGRSDVADLLQACVDEAMAPSRPVRASIPLEEFRWLAPCGRLFQPDPLGSYKSYDWSGLDGLASLAVDRAVGDRLAAVRALRPHLGALRIGWLFVAGRAPDGRSTFLPLVSVPIKVTRGSILGPAYLAPAGDATLARSLPSDARRSLAERLHLGGPRVDALTDPAIPDDVLDRLAGLRRFALDAATALGLPASRVVSASRPADELRDGAELVVVAGYGVYAEREEEPPGAPSSAARHWAPALGRTETALHALSRGGSHETADAEAVESVFALSGGQRDVVRAARRAGVTVVAGATGTGKTTTAAAVAADAAARGDRVLLVAGGAAAVDDLIAILLATSAMPPIAFGSTDRRGDVLGRLVETRHQIPIADAAEAAVARDRSIDELARRRDSVARELRAESAWLRRREGTASAAAARAPGLFVPDADLERARDLAADLERRHRGAGAARRRARAHRHLARLARVGRGVSRAELRAAVDEAVAEAGADVLDAIGGVDLESAWGRLSAVDELARQAIARARAAEVRNHDGAGRSRLTILRTIGEVHRALRNDRSRRRLQFAQVSTGRLTEVLPVWVGSASDVEELLPLRAGLFDVVVVEDATTVTTATVAAALLRSRARLIVFGDPDHRAVEGNLFALAAGGRAPLRLLDQFGVAPEIAGCAFVLDAVPIAPPRAGPGGTVAALAVAGPDQATAAVLGAATRRPRHGDIGVVTASPERAVAIEAALLEALDLDAIERARLCVGPADGPAWKRDVVVADVTGADDAAGVDRLVRGVLARARRRLIVVHDGGAVAVALLAAARADPAVAPFVADPWTDAVVAVLDEAGFGPVRGRRAGRHVLDVAADCSAGPTALVTRPHPGGVDEHIDRHLELARAGWRVIEVLPSRWAQRLEKLPDHVENRWRG